MTGMRFRARTRASTGKTHSPRDVRTKVPADRSGRCIGVGIGLDVFAAGHAADEPRAAAELLVQALEQPGMRFSAGRHRLSRMRPSTLAFMWQIM
jgi:hypothetical protein